MLIKKWFEKTLEITLCSFLIACLLVCGFLLITKSLDIITVRTVMGALLVACCIPILTLIESCEKVFLYEDKVEIRSFGKVKKTINFKNIQRIQFCRIGLRKGIILRPTTYCEGRDSYVRLLYSKENWLLINKQLEKLNIYLSIESGEPSVKSNVLKYGGYLMICCTIAMINIALMSLPFFKEDTSASVAFFLFLSGAVISLIVAIYSLTYRFSIDCDKIEIRHLFRKTCIYKTQLENIKLIDKKSVNEHLQYIACVIPTNIINEYDFENNDGKKMEKRLRRDKRVIVFYYTAEVQRSLSACGWLENH